MLSSIGGSGECRHVGLLGIDKVRRAGEGDQPSTCVLPAPGNEDRHMEDRLIAIPSVPIMAVS